MQAVVRLYSILPDEIKRFLSEFYGNSNFDIKNIVMNYQVIKDI